MIMFGNNEMVKIDVVHAHLISGLVASHKSEKILELGVGGGGATDSILASIDYNGNNPSYTLVDNKRKIRR